MPAPTNNRHTSTATASDRLTNITASPRCGLIRTRRLARKRPSLCRFEAQGTPSLRYLYVAARLPARIQREDDVDGIHRNKSADRGNQPCVGSAHLRHLLAVKVRDRRQNASRFHVVTQPDV